MVSEVLYKCDACSDKFGDEEGERYWCNQCNGAIDKCYDCSIGQPSLKEFGPLLQSNHCPVCGHELTFEREL